MEIDQRTMDYRHLEHYGMANHPYTTSDNSASLFKHGQYCPDQVSGWSSSIHPFHENINWVSYGLPNPGAKCPPMSAHSYAIARRNERERNRVRNINSTFDNLRKHLPNSGRKRKLSKVDTLKMAVKYISHLQQILDSTSEGEKIKKDVVKAKITEDNNNVLTAMNIKERCYSPTGESRLSFTESEACSHKISPGSDYKLRDPASPVDVAEESERVDGTDDRYSANGSEVKEFRSCSVSTEPNENTYIPKFLGGVHQDNLLHRSCALYGNSSYLHCPKQTGTTSSESKPSCQYSNSGECFILNVN